MTKAERAGNAKYWPEYRPTGDKPSKAGYVDGRNSEYMESH